MTQIEVQRLRLRGPPARVGLTAFRIEDALRTEIVDDGRLILVRRLALGALADTSGARALPDRVGAACRRVIEQARHGGEDGAASADCVWFRDAAEARRVLLRLLAAGRMPQAWFWRLAVPDWCGEPVEMWVAEQLRVALSRDDGEAVAAIVLALIEMSAIVVVLRAVAALVTRDPDVQRAAEAIRRSGIARDSFAVGGPPDASPKAKVDSALPDLREASNVARLIPRLAPALREGLRQVFGVVGRKSPVTRSIAEAIVARHYPELSLARASYIRCIDEWVEQMADPTRHRAALVLSDAAHTPLPRPVPSATVRASPTPWSTPAVRSTSELPQRSGGEAASEKVSPPRAVISPLLPDSVLADDELFSPAAGLLLVVGPLVALGWREWLAARPDLLATAPTARLFATIARHYRVPEDDPVRLLWPEPDDPADWPAAWRIGLDRWLRRHTRRKLAQVVLRPGWLTIGDRSIVARFRADAADIRLRRLALDRDPGWVDWLGLSVRYAYRDRAGDALRRAMQ